MTSAIVSDLMTTPVLTLRPETTLAGAAEGMAAEGIKSVVVIDDNCQPAGILTSTDFVDLVAAGDDADERTLGDAMTTEVVTVGPDTAVAAAAERLLANDINHLPVVDGDNVVGILSTTDLTEHLAADAVSGAVGSP